MNIEQLPAHPLRGVSVLSQTRIVTDGAVKHEPQDSSSTRHPLSNGPFFLVKVFQIHEVANSFHVNFRPSQAFPVNVVMTFLLRSFAQARRFFEEICN